MRVLLSWQLTMATIKPQSPAECDTEQFEGNDVFNCVYVDSITYVDRYLHFSYVLLQLTEMVLLP